MQRINVVGTSCSGKTTLARAIAARLSLPYTELDALFWGPRWEPVPAGTFLARVTDATRGERWVIDGGYSKVRPPIWEHADTVIWLDYPMHVVLGRWARRTVARIRSGEEFWPGTGNRESVSNALRRDSLLIWILSTHRRRRRTMAAQLAAQPHLSRIRLRSPAAADRWLASL
jgi:adenylate kinase family enzyme